MKTILLSVFALDLAATPEEPVCEVKRTINLMLAKAK